MSAFYSCWGWKEAVKKKKPFPNLFTYVPALLSPHANCCNTSFTLYSEEAVKLRLNVTFNAVWRWCTIFFSFYNHKNSHGVKMTLWHVRNMVTHDFICTITFIQKQPIVPIVISNLYRMFLKFEFSRLNWSIIGWLHTVCNSMLLWDDLLFSPLKWCFNDAWNVQICSVSFISVPCASVKIGHRCFYVIFMRAELSIQRGPFILCTWEQVSKCQLQWFIFHVRIEMSPPSIIPDPTKW